MSSRLYPIPRPIAEISMMGGMPMATKTPANTNSDVYVSPLGSVGVEYAPTAIKPKSEILIKSRPSYSTGGPSLLTRAPAILTPDESNPMARPLRSSDHPDGVVMDLYGTSMVSS